MDATTAAFELFAQRCELSFIERGSPDLLSEHVGDGERAISGIVAGRLPSGQSGLLAAVVTEVTPALGEAITEELTGGLVRRKNLELAFTHPDGSASAAGYLRKFGVMVTSVPEAAAFMPILSCRDTQVRGLVDRLGGPGGLLRLIDRYEFESVALNRNYRIGALRGISENRVRQLFSPVFIDWLASNAPKGTYFELHGGLLVVTVDGDITTVADVERLCEIGSYVANRIRSEAAESAIDASSQLDPGTQETHELDENLAEAIFPVPPTVVSEAAQQLSGLAKDAGEKERTHLGLAMRMMMRVARRSIDRERALQLGLEAVLRAYANAKGLELRSSVEWLARRASLGLEAESVRVMAGPLPGSAIPCELIVRVVRTGTGLAVGAVVVFEMDPSVVHGTLRVMPCHAHPPLYVAGFAIHPPDGKIEIADDKRRAAKAAEDLAEGRLHTTYEVITSSENGTFPALDDSAVNWLLDPVRAGKATIVIQNGGLAMAEALVPLKMWRSDMLDQFCLSVAPVARSGVVRDRMPADERGYSGVRHQNAAGAHSIVAALPRLGATDAPRPKRLLRQPGGFEGELTTVVLPISHHTIILEVIDAKHRHLGRDAARSAACAPVKDPHHGVACIDELYELKSRVLPGPKPVDEEPLHPGVSLVHTGHRDHRSRRDIPDHVLREYFPPRLPVARREALEHLTNDLDFLLRHRPRSYSESPAASRASGSS